MKNRAIPAFLCAIFTACGSVSITGDEQLNGVWVSDKERTLANIAGVKLSGERLRYLRENLGKLRLCFSGDKAAAFFSDTAKGEVELGTYQVTGRSSSSVTVKTSQGVTRTLHLEAGCFHHEVPEWGYEEYFCRQVGVENPCT